MKRLHQILVQYSGILVIVTLLMTFGFNNCALAATLKTDPSTGLLNGEWGGVHINQSNTSKLKITGTLTHQKDAKNFAGTMTIDGEEYNVVGTTDQKTVQMTLTSAKSTITWNGTYVAGRMKGAFTQSTSTATKGNTAAVTTASGDFGLIKFLDIKGIIELGPWLLYTQDSTNNKSNMTVRIGLTDSTFTPNPNGGSTFSYKPSASITATDPNGKSYGPFVMKSVYKNQYSTTGPVYDTVNIFEYTFGGLQSNSLFSYTITINDSVNGTYPVSASFRTPPSRDDIKNNGVTKQVFYSYGDNRRKYADASDNLPYVEENLCQFTDISTDPAAQSFTVHNGDANTFGKAIEEFDIMSLYRYYGWKYEWLRASNKSNDSYKHDVRYHTWLRASVPTFMSAGNHEGKTVLADQSFTPSDFNLYGNLMAGIYADNNNDHITLQRKGNSYDTYTYMVDNGGMRIIVLNTYNCYSSSDATTILNSIKSWMQTASPDGPIVLVLHPSPWGNEGSDEIGSYWNSSANLRKDLVGMINDLNTTNGIDVKKRLIVISGHTHVTARTYQDGVTRNGVTQDGINYYILGTGGAADMNGPKSDSAKMVNFSSGLKQPDANLYRHFAYGKFTVDYSTRKINAVIYGMKGVVVDEQTWSY